MNLRHALPFLAVIGLALPSGGAAAQGAKAPQRASTTIADGSVLNQAIDSYDPATRILTIPLVQVGARYYRDVQITVGTILSVGVAKGPSGVFDSYDGATGQLTIPVVRIGTTVYNNALITVGAILSVGGPVDSYSVTTDLSQVSYPASYRTVTTDAADVNTNPCNLNLSKVTYPASWLGQYPLPVITGAPLKPGIKRAVSLKDIGLDPGDPAFVLHGAAGAPDGCVGDLRAALQKTINRLKALGADYVNVPQWHWASKNADGSWYITRAEDTYSVMTDSDLAFFVQQAHAAGLKVVMGNQIQGFVDTMPFSPAYVPALTAENLQKWFTAYQAYISERAIFFGSIGVDVWEVGCSMCMYGDVGDGSAQQMSLFAAQSQLALQNMKAHFNGATLMWSNPWLYQTPAMASAIDIVEIGTWGFVQFPADQPLSVESYRTRVAASSLQFTIDLYKPFGKTIMVAYGSQSRSNAFSLPGYVEEATCTAAPNDLNGSPSSCIQRASNTDFSVQAIVHEATLEGINALAVSAPLIVMVLDYWETDSLMPFTAFPNLAFSIRNKPAEGIVKAWFAR
jgi:hypothetical protein